MKVEILLTISSNNPLSDAPDYVMYGKDGL